MSDTPKFEVIDRRKQKAQREEEEGHRQDSVPAATPEPTSEPDPAANLGPRLVTSEPRTEVTPEAKLEQTESLEGDEEGQHALPQAPSAEEAERMAVAYSSAAQRIEDLVRAQNPAMGAQPPIAFENLIQQLYLSAMIQMGAGAQPGERPRIDILGARTTIDLLSVLAEKTRPALSAEEDRMFQSVLFEVRSVFLELASMVSLSGMQPPMPPPPGAKR